MPRSYHTSSAWRLATTCPDCGSSLRVQRRRIDGERFVGCARFPSCRFTTGYDDVLAGLGDRVRDLERDLAAARRQRPAPPARVDVARELRALIALAHPDRWPDTPLAHEITCRLTELRSRVAA